MQTRSAWRAVRSDASSLRQRFQFLPGFTISIYTLLLRAALATGVLAIGGLAGCGTPSTTGTPPRTTFPKTTVYQLLVPTTATPTSTRSALPVADAAGTIAGGQPPTAVAASAAPTTTTAKGGTTPTTARSGAGAATYTVVANDTLSGIARKSGTTIQAIIAANGWADGASHRINPGDVITLPAKMAETLPRRPAARRSARSDGGPVIIICSSTAIVLATSGFLVLSTRRPVDVRAYRRRRLRLTESLGL